jgi:extradiol dioxygenase family protein
MLQPFHLAVPVNDIESSRYFYGNVLGCSEGRSDTLWVDFDFFGHQLVIHQTGSNDIINRPANQVDKHNVPVPHFGIVLEEHDWKCLADSLKAKNISFIIEPSIRFEGLPGEQHTMFFLDPSGNALEFKSFKNMAMLFAK